MARDARRLETIRTWPRRIQERQQAHLVSHGVELLRHLKGDESAE